MTADPPAALEQALEQSHDVKAKVAACAEDLEEVTATLARGIADIKQVEIALHRSRAALAEAETALLTAQEGEPHATLRALHDPATGLPNRVLFDDRVTQQFLYLLVNPKSRADVERKAIAVLGDIAQAIEVGGRGLVIRASIGSAGDSAGSSVW